MNAARVPIDWPALMPDVARVLLGEPNARLSNARELRYGTHGSLAVHRIYLDRAGAGKANVEPARASLGSTPGRRGSRGHEVGCVPARRGLACPRFSIPPTEGRQRDDVGCSMISSPQRGRWWWCGVPRPLSAGSPIDATLAPSRSAPSSGCTTWNTLKAALGVVAPLAGTGRPTAENAVQGLSAPFLAAFAQWVRCTWRVRE